MPVLTAVDVVGIQRFVFASNRLRDVDGGSTILRKATSSGTDSWVGEMGYDKNVLTAGGGNLILRFEDLTQARNFALRYTRRMLEQAPGLEAVIEHQDYSAGGMAAAVQKILEKIQASKAARQPTIPLLNLGVSEICFQTGLAATGYDEESHQESHPISSAVRLRRDAGEASSFWKSLLPKTTLTCDGDKRVELEFPADLDLLGRTPGELSLIGIVHVDGNGIGRLVGQWLWEQIDNGVDDDTFAQSYHKLSQAIDGHVRNIVKQILSRVVDAIHCDQGESRFVLKGRNGEFALHQDGEKLYLPIRPIITAGEDITFASDGRIAMDLTAFALEEFVRQPIQGLGTVSACAGVSLVHSHTPIIRSYELAEELCRNAKQQVREFAEIAGSRDGDGLDAGYQSALDWHVGITGVIESLEDVRSRQYERNENHLTLRPYFLGKRVPREPGTWTWLVEDLILSRGFQSDFWRRHRSKAKELIELAAVGPDAVQRTVDAWRIPHPCLPWPEGLPPGGYLTVATGTGKYGTPLLDALELADMYIALGE